MSDASPGENDKVPSPASTNLTQSPLTSLSKLSQQYFKTVVFIAGHFQEATVNRKIPKSASSGWSFNVSQRLSSDNSSSQSTTHISYGPVITNVESSIFRGVSSIGNTFCFIRSSSLFLF